MTMRMSARAKFFLYLFLIFMVILTVIPLLYTVSASFKTNMEIATGGINLIPKTFTFDNYKTVWSMSGTGIASKVTYTDYTINSIKVSLMTVVLVVLFTSMSAYCFQRGNFPGQKFLYWLFMATMFIGAGTVTMFPLLRITTKLGLNNLPGLALVQFGTAGASNLFLTMGYLKTISKELDDAAKIDGAGVFRRFFRITVPLSTPMIFYNLVTGVIGAMQTNHTMVFAGYDGAGPRNSIYFIAVKIYNEGFGGQDFGYASALAWVLFVIIAMLTGITFATNKWVYTGDE